MMYILFSIISSAGLVTLFKLFERYKIHTLTAIVVNYSVAASLGVLKDASQMQLNTLPQQPWFYNTLILGFVFITIFVVTAITAQKIGVAVAAVVSKMSMLLPLLFGFVYFNESTGFLKITGITLSLASVFLISYRTNGNTQAQNTGQRILWITLLFCGTGFIDLFLNYNIRTHVPTAQFPFFMSTIFTFACITGLFWIGGLIIQKKYIFSMRSVLAGVILGCVNWASLYFLLQSLQNSGFESTAVFPINNIGIILTSSLIGILFLREKLTRMQWSGIAIAILSIVLIGISEWH